MVEKLTVPTMKKRLDTLLKAVRYEDSPDGKINICQTCLMIFPIPELQCGHFIKRGDQQLKYVPTNVFSQCRRCNHFLDGAQDKAAYYIIKTHGLKAFNDLIETDYKWLAKKLPTLKRKDFVEYYNFWLGYNRHIERTYKIKLIPATWKTAQ